MPEQQVGASSRPTRRRTPPPCRHRMAPAPLNINGRERDQQHVTDLAGHVGHHAREHDDGRQQPQRGAARHQHAATPRRSAPCAPRRRCPMRHQHRHQRREPGEVRYEPGEQAMEPLAVSRLTARIVSPVAGCVGGDVEPRRERRERRRRTSVSNANSVAGCGSALPPTSTMWRKRSVNERRGAALCGEVAMAGSIRGSGESNASGVVVAIVPLGKSLIQKATPLIEGRSSTVHQNVMVQRSRRPPPSSSLPSAIGGGPGAVQMLPPCRSRPCKSCRYLVRCLPVRIQPVSGAVWRDQIDDHAAAVRVGNVDVDAGVCRAIVIRRETVTGLCTYARPPSGLSGITCPLRWRTSRHRPLASRSPC